MKEIGKRITRYGLLVFIWFALNLIDFYHVQLVFVNRGDLTGRVLMAVVDVAGLLVILPFCRKRGWPLVWVLFLALFGVKTFLTVIEAIYLPVLVPMAGMLFFNGVIVSFVFVVAVVFLFGLFDQNQIPQKRQCSRLEMGWLHWIWKIPVTSFFWIFLFVFFGGVVFINLAGMLDPAALAEYNNLDMPVWVLPFQGFRALMWLFLVFPLLAQLLGTKKQLFWRIGLLMACWMGSNLLAAANLPVGLRLAHFAEVFGETFVFGAWLVFLFVCRETAVNFREEVPSPTVTVSE